MKYFEKILLLILIFGLMIGILSCQKKGEADEENERTLSFLDYSVVYPDKTSEILLNDVRNMYSTFIAVSQSDNNFCDDFLRTGVQADSNAKEILIGHTNRPETAEILSQLQKNEYAVAVVDNKIVITGVVDSLTPVALEYFVNTYLCEGTDGKIEENLFYRTTADVVTLVESEKNVCSIVRPYGSLELLEICYTISDAVKKASGVSVSIESEVLSGEEPDGNKILLGNMHYTSSRTLFSNLNPNQCKIEFINDKIVVGAGTQDMYKKAADLLADIISFACYTDANGKISVVIPKISIVREDDAFDSVQGVPSVLGDRPFDGVYDSYDGAAMMYWNNATEDMTGVYTNALESNGFSKYQELNNDSIKSVTYFKDNSSVHTYYLKRTKEFRVITQNDDLLPVNPYDYEKKCDVAVTQLDIFHSATTYIGMGYLIRLEDGTFVVIDGGKTRAKDAELLYNTMCEQLPDGVDEIVISAWIMTHGHHDDHSAVLKHFIANYSNSVTVKRLIGNDISDLEFQKLKGTRSFDYNSVSGKFGGCVYDKAHTGEQYFFPGVTFTILHTDEDIYPQDMWDYNDASIVFDAKIKTEWTPTADGGIAGLNKLSKDGVIRFIWFGDIGSLPSGNISNMYAEDLKCDILQMPHHGIGGKHATLYSYCSPQLAYWPAGVVIATSEEKIGDADNNKIILGIVNRVIYRHEGSHTIIIGNNTVSEMQKSPNYSV